MTAKAIVFTAHAKERLKRRGITRTEVRWLIARGIRSRAPSIRGRDDRWSYRDTSGGVRQS